MNKIGILMVAALSTLALAARTTEGGKREDQDKDKKEARAEIGKPAPAFELKDLDGKTVKLSDYKGKTVVLEWFNPECPFVAYGHTKGTLKGMDEKVTKDGVVWLAINSGAAGKEGADAKKNKEMRQEWKMAASILMDESGVVGKSYGAKNTPQMFIIDAKGNLAYRGGVDNAPMGKVDTEGAQVVNYVEAALAELKAGKPVTKNDTKAYGCSVKYAQQPEKEKVKG